VPSGRASAERGTVSSTHAHDMAEIPIERKEGRNWLPLLLLGLLALALLVFFLRRDRAEPGVATADSTATTTSTGAVAGAAGAAGGAAAAGATPGGDADVAIAQFVQFAQQRDTARESEDQHQYTAEGTRRLAAALEAIAGGTPDIRVYADSMRSSIERLQRSSATDRHADDAKAAFSAAVSAMGQIDSARGRTRDVAPMRAIYSELNGQRPLLPQLNTVHRFFDAAAQALQDARG
jgi:hypothetical protein